jgi:hypothetical protein
MIKEVFFLAHFYHVFSLNGKNKATMAKLMNKKSGTNP